MLSGRLAEIAAPARLGVGFRWLMASSWVDQPRRRHRARGRPAAGRLARRDDAFLVALAATVQWLPPLLFGLVAGALTDRLDRRLIVVSVDLARAAVLAVLTLAVATDHVSIAVVLAALFVLGTAEVFADNSSQTLLPMLVRARRPRARPTPGCRPASSRSTSSPGRRWAPPCSPSGAAWAFGTQAVLVALGAVLVTRVALPPHRRDRRAHATCGTTSPRASAGCVHHAAVRTLVLTIFTFNITFGAAWSVLVLYATRAAGPRRGRLRAA